MWFLVLRYVYRCGFVFDVAFAALFAWVVLLLRCLMLRLGNGSLVNSVGMIYSLMFWVGYLIIMVAFSDCLVVILLLCFVVVCLFSGFHV